MATLRMQFAIGCCLLTLLGGCAKPEYWISGLTLPPGSTVVQKIDSAHSSQQMPPLPFGGKITKSLGVSFENPNGWDAVAAHIDGRMRAAGYTESMDSMSQMTQGIPGASMPDISGMMRMYTKDGSKYMVSLQNFGEVAKYANQGSGQKLPDMSSMGMGTYMLMVAEMDK